MLVFVFPPFFQTILRTFTAPPPRVSHAASPGQNAPLGQQSTQRASARAAGTYFPHFPQPTTQQFLELALPIRRPTMPTKAGHGAEHA